MEIASLVREYISTLIWPAVLVGIIVGFRKELSRLLNRCTQADLPGGITLGFQEEVRQAVVLSEEVRAAPKKSTVAGKPAIPLTEANARMLNLGLQPSSSGLDLSYYRRLAEQDPNLALAGLGIELETMINNVAKGFNVKLDSPSRMSSTLRKLLEADAVTREQADLVASIYRLRNAAVHGSIVSLEEANAIIDAAQVLRDYYLSWLSWGFPDGWKPRGQGAE